MLGFNLLFGFCVQCHGRESTQLSYDAEIWMTEVLNVDFAVDMFQMKVAANCKPIDDHWLVVFISSRIEDCSCLYLDFFSYTFDLVSIYFFPSQFDTVYLHLISIALVQRELLLLQSLIEYIDDFALAELFHNHFTRNVGLFSSRRPLN